ncbi:helix-turn-helix domain-containing protein [Sphingobium chungbukense]|uniref:helix-turn-helix domain-containing protein n=1 Tax=Sphingobium chungbukense TaxID=56193 RepID=UPI0018DCAA39|nr:helix-turn-helix domain-containing protein [Sphingobium chungbukense]
MSVRLMSLVWELDLPPGEKLVLLALADQANDDGLQCWPAVSTIMKRSGQGERTVRRAIVDLERKGHLTRKMRDGNSTQYHVHPGQSGTPAKSAPLPKATETPAKLAPKPSRTTKDKQTQGAHVLPDDWCPRDFGLKTKSREIVDGWPPGELESQVEHFTAHHRSKGSKFKDWQDAWSTWVLNSRRFGGRNHGNDRSGGSYRHQRGDGFLNALREAADVQAGHPFAGNG